MTRERFQILAEAYGGDLAHWPAEDRAQAAEHCAADPAWTERALAAAGRLDRLLQDAPILAARPDLIDRIVASAPSQAIRRWTAWVVPAGLGAGLAAACAAGLVVGVQLSHSAVDNEAVITAIAGDDASLYADEDA